MKKDIILAGVGGQGILSIATVLGYISLTENLFLKQAEVHGMSQRGGAVQSHFRISDKEIASDLIPQGKADMIISVEPVEALRYVSWLSPEGWIIANSTPYVNVNVNDYPNIDEVYAEIRKYEHHVLLDADKNAKEAGSIKSANIVMLGAASPFLGIPEEKFMDAIQFIFGKKGEDVVSMNIRAFNTGKRIASEILV